MLNSVTFVGFGEVLIEIAEDFEPFLELVEEFLVAFLGKRWYEGAEHFGKIFSLVFDYNL